MTTTQNTLMQTASIMALVITGATTMGGAPAIAQDQGALEEVIVTARKRDETLQDVPFSINAKTEDAMRNAGINSLEDLSVQIAGFSIQNLGPGQSQVAIRGISSGQIVRDQPGVKEQVGVYLDESVISLSLFTPDIDLFDMNRVEVLRGPQGTLYGSGSLGGTVRYITNKPNLDRAEGVVEAQGSFIKDGDFQGAVKAMANIPLAEGKAALRAVGFYQGFGGFIDAIQPDLSVNKNVNDGRRIGARVAIEFHPSENLTITPRLVYQDVEVGGFNRQDAYNILANPFTTTRPAVTIGEREQFTQLEENFTDEFLLLDAKIEYDFSGLTFTSVSSYTNRDVLQVRDATQLIGSVTYQFFDQTEGVFNLDAPLYDATEAEVFTQEVRLASNDDGPLQWVAGAFYSKTDRLYGQILETPGFEDAIGIPTSGFPGGATKDQLFFSNIPYDLKQIALFGEASYQFNDRLNAAVGLRWYDFDEDRILNFDGILADVTEAQPGSTKSDGISPRVIVSYEANDDVQVNAQVSKGFRLGGINDPLNTGICTPEDLETFGGRPGFGDEKLWNYEVGMKSTIMDGRGTFNIAAFYGDAKDMQFTVDAGTCSSRIVYNADARTLGLEAELTLQPSNNLMLNLVGSWIDSEVRESVPSAGLLKGSRLPTVPQLQFAGSLTYTRPIGSNEGFITATVQHVGSRFTQAVDAVGPDRTVDLTVIPIGAPTATSFAYSTELPAYTTGNIRFGMRNDRWEVALFINNIWDELAKLAIDRERSTLARVGFLVNQPRTIGLSLRAVY